MLWISHIVLLVGYLFYAAIKCIEKVTRRLKACTNSHPINYFQQYQNIIFHMNRIEVDLDDEALLVQVECTSLQLIHQPIVLHAKGFFVIDYSTLLKVR